MFNNVSNIADGAVSSRNSETLFRKDFASQDHRYSSINDKDVIVTKFALRVTKFFKNLRSSIEFSFFFLYSHE